MKRSRMNKNAIIDDKFEQIQEIFSSLVDIFSFAQIKMSLR